jgi:hypothetical protein
MPIVPDAKTVAFVRQAELLLLGLATVCIRSRDGPGYCLSTPLAWLYTSSLRVWITHIHSNVVHWHSDHIHRLNTLARLGGPQSNGSLTFIAM